MRGLKVCVQLPQGVPRFVFVTPYQVSLECKFRSYNQQMQGRHQFDKDSAKRCSSESGKPRIRRVLHAVWDATMSSWPKARRAVCRRVAAVW